ncbi:chemotaxis protein CheW [Heyndrickxia acidicola]|uniref:Chemotaxis protein CheW n=1 Tax=Heyndrickxia acidicola TaxID=209389 RepID=A0ABU6MFK6_9BACI|nr:chemotaxis protein CheW [Heyndrickxia acidicola]MED1202052.1 chemotaxis protein CheW [Heyndrickxia acidicola]
MNLPIETTVEDLKMIVFKLLDKEYAIPVQQIRAIEKVHHITRVPGTPSYTLGVINLRGVIIPIIDLQCLFNGGRMVIEESTRIIIVMVNNMEVGLMVEAANDVVDIPAEIIEPQPEVFDSMNSEFISGVAKVGKRLLLLVNIEQALKPVQ